MLDLCRSRMKTSGMIANGTNDKNDIKCYNCNKYFRHIARYWPEWKCAGRTQWKEKGIWHHVLILPAPGFSFQNNSPKMVVQFSYFLTIHWLAFQSSCSLSLSTFLHMTPNPASKSPRMGCSLPLLTISIIVYLQPIRVPEWTQLHSSFAWGSYGPS